MTSKVEQRIAEIVAFELNPKQWVTDSKVPPIRRLYPREMEASHIRNVIAMIQHGRMRARGRTECNGLTIEQWARVFENELLRRSLQAGAPWHST